MFKGSDEHFSRGKAWLIIFISTLLVSGSASFSLWYYGYMQQSLSEDERFRIQSIAQVSADTNAVKTPYLAELLHLSKTKITNLYAFNYEEGVENLERSPVIKGAKIFPIEPDTLQINYQLRLPLAYLLDYDNAAVDQDGILFPMSPFFTPKRLIEIYLGLKKAELEYQWGEKIQDERMQLALKIYQELQSKGLLNNLDVKRLDLSQAFEASLGKRKIVLSVREEKNINYLLLSKESLTQAIANYLSLRKHLDNGLDQVLEFRIPQLAFISNLNY